MGLKESSRLLWLQRQRFSSTSRHKYFLSAPLSREIRDADRREMAMQLSKLPLETWVVVDRTREEWSVVSTHATQDAAETERDRRNEGLSRIQYSACMALEPVAQGMGRACG
jgi:hypothetical protein